MAGTEGEGGGGGVRGEDVGLPVHRGDDVARRRSAAARKLKHRMRLAFRSGALLLLLAGAIAYYAIFGATEAEEISSQASDPALEEKLDAFVPRRLGADCGGDSGTSGGLVIFFIIGVLYMFVALAIICDEFFVPALEIISDQLDMSPNVAGATLMAAGGSAPELFTSLIGTFEKSDVGFGTIVGSAVFNVLFVIGMCAVFSKELLELTWWPLARDSLYYTFSLIMLGTFFGIASEGIIEWYEALILFLLYFLYIVVMVNDDNLQEFVERNWLKEGQSIRKLEDDENVTFRKPSTFRAGVLKLMLSNKDLLETAGVGIVSKIAGNVKDTFDALDADGNGELDREEIRNLLVQLGTDPTDEELEYLMEEVAPQSGDRGCVSFEDFTTWYIASEARIRTEMQSTFDRFDTDQSGTIDKNELRHLLTSLGNKPTNEELDAGMADLDKDKDGQIDFAEFSEWYQNSLFWTEKKHEAEIAQETAEGLSLAPPEDLSSFALFNYIVTLPLVVLFYYTLPDVRKPGWDKWAGATFLLSIMWIGVFSWFMVSWAETIGATFGIPSVVMGLTFLAAGTSVPDLLSSVIVARQGEGDMAVSSSIGSNIFDVLVGLPVPWLLFNIVLNEPVTVGADSLFISLLVLIGMLVCVVTAIHCYEWKMTKNLGYVMFVLYVLFVAQDLARAEWC